MYTDSGLGALTFRTLFEKGKKLIQKAAPIVAAARPPAPTPALVPGTFEPVALTPPPSERPGWMLPALVGGGALIAFKLFRKGRR